MRNWLLWQCCRLIGIKGLSLFAKDQAVHFPFVNMTIRAFPVFPYIIGNHSSWAISTEQLCEIRVECQCWNWGHYGNCIGVISFSASKFQMVYELFPWLLASHRSFLWKSIKTTGVVWPLGTINSASWANTWPQLRKTYK